MKVFFSIALLGAGLILGACIKPVSISDWGGSEYRNNSNIDGSAVIPHFDLKFEDIDVDLISKDTPIGNSIDFDGSEPIEIHVDYEGDCTVEWFWFYGRELSVREGMDLEVSVENGFYLLNRSYMITVTVVITINDIPYGREFAVNVVKSEGNAD